MLEYFYKHKSKMMKSRLLAFFFAFLTVWAVILIFPDPIKAQAQGQPCGEEGKCDVSLVCDITGKCNPPVTGFQQAGYWQMPTVQQTQINAYGSEEGVSGEKLKSAMWGWDMAILGAYILGPLPEATGEVTGPAGGAVGTFGNLIAGMTSTPPVRTATYIADLGQSLGLAKPAYAQGTGFRALEPVLPLWKAFRNIAYFGFVIIFVVIGFMIMFRKNIDPQTVITVQSSLPKIIITLLLITFSYAIASLMIDLIYLLIYLLIGTFSTFEIIEGEKAKNILLGKTVFGIAFQDLIGPGKEEIAGVAAHAVADVVNSTFKGIGGKIIGGIGQTLAYVVFAVAILIAVFKLFFQLLMAYIGIIFSVIFAPIMLLFNALPGSNSFGSWLKGILANALVFPVTAVMFLIVAALMGSQKFGVVQGVGYGGSNQYPDLQLPFLGGGGVPTSALQAIIAIGFLMMMPKIIEMVQKMMGIEGGLMGMMGGAMEGVQAGWRGTGIPGLGRSVTGIGISSGLEHLYRNRIWDRARPKSESGSPATEQEPVDKPSSSKQTMKDTSKF